MARIEFTDNLQKHLLCPPVAAHGDTVRAVLEAAGIHDVLSKSLGSSNAINIVHATVEALRTLESPEQVAARRGLRVEDVAPAALLKAGQETSAAPAEPVEAGV